MIKAEFGKRVAGPDKNCPRHPKINLWETELELSPGQAQCNPLGGKGSFSVPQAKILVSPLTPLSVPASNPPANPVGSSFKIHPQSAHFSLHLSPELL